MSSSIDPRFVSAKLFLKYGVDEDDCVAITQQVIYGLEEISAGDFVYDRSEEKMVEVISVDMKKRMVTCMDGKDKFVKLYDECATAMKDKEIGWIARKLNRADVDGEVWEYSEIDDVQLKKILDNNGNCMLMREAITTRRAGHPPKSALHPDPLSNVLAEKDGKLIVYFNI